MNRNGNGAPVTNEMLVFFLENELKKLEGFNGPYTTVLRASIARTAQLLKFTGARSQAELEERIEANEQSVAEQHFQHGFREGRDRGRELGRQEVISMLRSISPVARN